MLEILCSGAVTIVGNRCAGEIESPSRRIRHHLHRVWIVDVGRRCRRHERSHLHRRILHHFNQPGDVLRPGKRLIALHVQVNIGCD